MKLTPRQWTLHITCASTDARTPANPAQLNISIQPLANSPFPRNLNTTRNNHLRTELIIAPDSRRAQRRRLVTCTTFWDLHREYSISKRRHHSVEKNLSAEQDAASRLHATTIRLRTQICSSRYSTTSRSTASLSQPVRVKNHTTFGKSLRFRTPQSFE